MFDLFAHFLAEHAWVGEAVVEVIFTSLTVAHCLAEHDPGPIFLLHRHWLTYLTVTSTESTKF